MILSNGPSLTFPWINTVKMNIFPRFLYQFQCILIFPRLSFFHKVDSLISDFGWKEKTPRFAMPDFTGWNSTTELPVLLLGNKYQKLELLGLYQRY